MLTEDEEERRKREGAEGGVEGGLEYERLELMVEIRLRLVVKPASRLEEVEVTVGSSAMEGKDKSRGGDWERARLQGRCILM